MVPQQGGISPCKRGTTELGLGHGGTLGATPSLCKEGLHCFLPLNHIHTQRTEKSAQTNHPRLLCYIAFRVSDLSNKCCLCSRLYTLFGCYFQTQENNNSQTKTQQNEGLITLPMESWGLIREQGTGLHHHHQPALCPWPPGHGPPVSLGSPWQALHCLN